MDYWQKDAGISLRTEHHHNVQRAVRDEPGTKQERAEPAKKNHFLPTTRVTKLKSFRAHKRVTEQRQSLVISPRLARKSYVEYFPQTKFAPSSEHSGIIRIFKDFRRETDKAWSLACPARTVQEDSSLLIAGFCPTKKSAHHDCYSFSLQNTEMLPCKAVFSLGLTAVYDVRNLACEFEHLRYLKARCQDLPRIYAHSSGSCCQAFRSMSYRHLVSD